MEHLSELIKSHEDWLTGRVLGYAKKHGYVKYSSTLREAWRMSIAGLSDSIILSLAFDPAIRDLHADDDYTYLPIVAFGAVEAAKHRRRGVSLSMFLSLLKYYRQSYNDLVTEAGFEPDLQAFCVGFIDRSFDRIEIAFAGEWASAGDDAVLKELQSTARALTEEKNKYLTIFESLSCPIIVLDAHNRIENMNRAASTLLYGDSAPGESYYSRPHREETVPCLSGHLDALSTDCDEIVFELELPVNREKRQFDVRVSRLLDVTDRHAGSIVMLNDVTERKVAEQAARRSRISI
jgi:PAS domain-containing protein